MADQWSMPVKDKEKRDPKANYITLAPDRQPWEQQPEESDTSYARFTAYLTMGLNRSVARASEMYASKSKEETGKCTWQTVANTYRWNERAQAYDKFNTAKALDEYQTRMTRFAGNLVGFMEQLSAEMLEALETKNLEKLKEQAPFLLTYVGKGNALNALINGHKQIFGEKQVQQRTVVIEPFDVLSEANTIDIESTPNVKPKADAEKAVRNNEKTRSRKALSSGDFDKLED